MPLREAYDYIVIGGGVIGMTTAREIAIRGASVAILDHQLFGNEASRVAGGILSPMRPWNENRDSTVLSEQAKILYPDFVLSLKNETEFLKGIRTDKPYSADHGGWDINPNALTKEQINYIKTANSSSSWLMDDKGTLKNESFKNHYKHKNLSLR